VLRNPLDVTPTQTAGIRMAGLMGSPSTAPVEKPAKRTKVVAPAVVVAPPPPPPPPRPVVETIRAGKRTVEDVK